MMSIFLKMRGKSLHVLMLLVSFLICGDVLARGGHGGGHGGRVGGGGGRRLGRRVGGYGGGGRGGGWGGGGRNGGAVRYYGVGGYPGLRFYGGGLLFWPSYYYWPYFSYPAYYSSVPPVQPTSPPVYIEQDRAANPTPGVECVVILSQARKGITRM